MILTPIPQDGQLPDSFPLDDDLRMVVEMTVRHFEKVGFAAPWIGYVAVENSLPVGTCAFKSPPVDGRVEIAYGTMPGFEGRGIATAMAKELVRIGREEDERLTVFAQTLPEQNASTSILKKLGFRLVGPVEHPEDGTVWEWELPPPASISIRHALASDAAAITLLHDRSQIISLSLDIRLGFFQLGNLIVKPGERSETLDLFIFGGDDALQLVDASGQARLLTAKFSIKTVSVDKSASCSSCPWRVSRRSARACLYCDLTVMMCSSIKSECELSTSFRSSPSSFSAVGFLLGIAAFPV